MKNLKKQQKRNHQPAIHRLRILHKLFRRRLTCQQPKRSWQKWRARCKICSPSTSKFEDSDGLDHSWIQFLKWPLILGAKLRIWHSSWVGLKTKSFIWRAKTSSWWRADQRAELSKAEPTSSHLILSNLVFQIHLIDDERPLFGINFILSSLKSTAYPKPPEKSHQFKASNKYNIGKDLPDDVIQELVGSGLKWF